MVLTLLGVLTPRRKAPSPVTNLLHNHNKQKVIQPREQSVWRSDKLKYQNIQLALKDHRSVTINEWKILLLCCRKPSLSFTCKIELWKYWWGCLSGPFIRQRLVKMTRKQTGREGGKDRMGRNPSQHMAHKWMAPLLLTSFKVGHWRDNCSVILDRKAEAPANHLQQRWGHANTRYSDLEQRPFKAHDWSSGNSEQKKAFWKWPLQSKWAKEMPNWSAFSNNSNSYPVLNTPVWKPF